MARPRVNKDKPLQSATQLTGSVDPVPETAVTEPVTAVSSGLPPIAELPEPSQEIFNKPEEPAEKVAPSEDGEKWDPAIHEEPARKNARGGWARRRGGARKAGSTSHAHRPGAKQAEAPLLTEKELTDKIEATAVLSAGLIFTCGTMIIGPCMEPDDNERAGITAAFRDYYRAAGVLEIPPWVGLVGALTLYGARRWNHPEAVKLTGRDKKAAALPSVN